VQLRALLFAASTSSCSLLVGEGFSQDPVGAASDAGDESANAADANEVPDTSLSDTSSDAAASSRYAAAVLADKPIGYWRCGETNGATLADSSGNNHPLTITAPLGASLGKPGALAGDPDGAIELDGSVALEAGDLFDFPGKVPFTYELWVKPRASDGALGRIIDKMQRQPSTGVPVEGSLLYYDHSYNASVRLGLERWATGAAVQFFFHEGDDARLPTDRFTHLVIAFDGTAPRLFRDGALAKGGSGNTDIPDNTISFKWAPGLVGTVDELAIYDVALTPTRIDAHYQAAK
jgi:hypothetical protein